MTAMHAPGPWQVTPMKRCFVVWRYAAGPMGSRTVERIVSARGNPRIFRSEEAAREALSKAGKLP